MKVESLPKFKFKNDAYTRKRGTPAMLMILCTNCGEYIMSYQKDGPGPLLRCYLDRIHHPEDLKSRQYIDSNKKPTSILECTSCKTTIGTPIIYKKESRPAYHMQPGFFSIKKI